jgi:hypothetical protein
MNRWNRFLFLIGLSLAYVLLLGPAAEVEACMSNDGCSSCSEPCCRSDGSSTYCGCDVEQSLAPPPTIVNFLGSRHARITVPGYKTIHLEPATDCVTAMSPVEGIERVNAVTNHNSDTGHRFKEVTFSPAERPGRELALLADEEGLPLGGQGTWFGFKSKITGTVTDGLPNHFVIDVTLKEGVSPEDFIQALKTQGVFATSSSTPDGVPNPGHHYFRRLTAASMLVLFPQRPEKPERGRP